MLEAETGGRCQTIATVEMQDNGESGDRDM